MECNLSGKTVLITGGSMGIGYACAEACLQRGANILICARTEAPLRAAAMRLQMLGLGTVGARVADISNRRDAEAVLEATVKECGGLHGLIHAAAVMGPVGPFTDVEPDAWLDTIRVNLYGTFLIVRETCRWMMATGGGRLVVLSGGGATAPFANYTAYGCGKAAVVRLVETVAQEMHPFNIEANCLAPGFVATRIHEGTLAAGEKAGYDYLERTRRELQEGGVPASLPARTAAFLLSDQAKGITGKLVAAVYDGWGNWPEHLQDLQDTDIFTLRRILPKDRGMGWQ